MKSDEVISTARSKSKADPGTVRMAVADEQTEFANRDRRIYRHSCQILGGRKFLQHQPGSRSAVHRTIVSGMPYGSLLHLVAQMEALKEVDIVKVLGISARTLRRQSEAPDKPMPIDLASKTWLLAETLAKAAEIFGSQEDAELWMSRPAMGLDDQRPIDLLQTVQGAELVNDFLGRLEYGVYT